MSVEEVMNKQNVYNCGLHFKLVNVTNIKTLQTSTDRLCCSYLNYSKVYCMIHRFPLCFFFPALN